MLFRSIARNYAGVSLAAQATIACSVPTSSLLRLSDFSGCNCVNSSGTIQASRSFSSSSSNLMLISPPVLRSHFQPKLNSPRSNFLADLLKSSSLSGARSYSAVTIDAPAPVIEFNKIKELSSAASTNHLDKDFLIFDVREPDEYAEGHIPNSINLPYKSAPGALGLEAEEFQEAFGFEKPSADKELVFYCRSGVRSTAAEALAATFGYQK